MVYDWFPLTSFCQSAKTLDLKSDIYLYTHPRVQWAVRPGLHQSHPARHLRASAQQVCSLTVASA